MNTGALGLGELRDRDHHAREHEHDDHDLHPDPVAGIAAKASGPSARGLMSRPSGEALNPTLKAVSDAVLAVAAQSVGGRGAAEAGGRRPRAGRCPLRRARHPRRRRADSGASWSSGMSDELIASMGPLPRTHGMLGAMLEAARPLPDRRHPRRPPLPGLVAAAASGHALVPGRPDHLARRGDHRRLLPDREDRRATPSTRRIRS